MTPRALLLAAPASGSGKTLLALGLLRALRDAGLDVAGAKSGPDHIDPRFHEAASGRPSFNLDAWAMAPGALRARAREAGAGLLVVEGAMGALDGAAPDGAGSAADLAEALGAPVAMILDVARMSQSAALPLAGLAALRPGLRIAGAVLNRVGSARHAAMATGAVERAGFRVFGALPRLEGLALPSRHLGLVQAAEHPDLEGFVARAGRAVAGALDLEALAGAAAPVAEGGEALRLPPLGQRIAVASDAAFAFAYPHALADWRALGAEILPFSPLADEAPAAGADAVFLPGGYPELHAGRLAGAARFLGGVREAAARGAAVYGECGGYMALGEALEDAAGAVHRMAGLLPLETSFARRRMTLGYRRLAAREGAPWEGALRAHEFHYASILREGAAERLFEACDAAETPLAPMGLRRGRVCGSFAHVIGPG